MPTRAVLMQAATVGLGALMLSGCGLFTSAPSSDDAVPSETQSPEESHQSGDGHSHDEFYEGIPDVTWSPSTDAEVEAIASEVMNLFARPDVPERRWFTDLLPHLSEEYAEDAQYIDPANIRVAQVLSGPVLVREKNNPLTVSADFVTDTGPWSVLLHRVGQEDPWLVEAIQPTDPTAL